MGNVNFYLKAPAKASGKSFIYLKHKYNGNVLVFSFGQNIDHRNWNANKQRVKNNRITTGDGQYLLNDLLNTLITITKNAYNSEIRNGIPRPDSLKKKLHSYVYKRGQTDKPNFYDLIDRFITGEIKHKGLQVTKLKKRFLLISEFQNLMLLNI